MQTQLKSKQNKNKLQYSKDVLYYGRKHCPHSAQNHRLGPSKTSDAYRPRVVKTACWETMQRTSRGLGGPPEVLVFMLKEKSTML